MKFNLSKKAIISICVVCALVLAFAIIFPIVYCVALKVELKATAVQVEESQKLHVEWDTSKPADKVTISVYHDGDLINNYTTTKVDEILSGERDIDGIYGKLQVKVAIKRGIYTTSKKVKVNLSAQEYNIAPITATMPVTIFTLSLDEITNHGQIPTFVWFKRSGAWDWSKLPENVYPMPTIDSNDFLNSQEEKMYRETSKYVKELHEINKESKFNFYYNDYFAYGWVQATIANGIPTENYKVVLLSDGTASFSYFNNHFDNDNADNEYAKMAANWEKLKKEVASKGKYNKRTKAVIKADTLREYAYVMATEEENVEWWLTRINGTLATNNSSFYEKVSTNKNVKVKDLATLLTTLQNSESDYMNETKLKQLYKFSDDMFSKAQENGKKVMIILGTWTDTENSTNFDSYVKATMAYYGDEYVYYYKGHPKNPTNSVRGKLEHLNKLGLIDVDSTIPAELLFFFNPDAYCSGYASTTFVSLIDEKSCGIFNSTKSQFNESYKENIDFFISTAINGQYGVVQNEKSVLLEFTDTSNYDIAVYDTLAKTLKYYKLNNGVGVEVK